MLLISSKKASLIFGLSTTLLSLVRPVACSAQDGNAASSSGEEKLEEIVVTATRRNENLQNVPIAVSSLSSDALARTQITDALELATQTPGMVNVQSTFANEARIRGVGSSDVAAGEEQSVATYIDGVYQASPYTANLAFNNIDRVEVLLGPQGTLFGRNATGGAIQIITKDPSQTPALSASIGGGNYGTTDGNLYATTGFGPDLAGDVAMNYHDQAQGMAYDLTTKQPFLYDSNFSLRNKWLYTPNADTKITFTADYSIFNAHDADFEPIAGTFFAGGVPNEGYYTALGELDSEFHGKTYGFAGKINQALDWFDIVSITAYRDTQAYEQFDNDGTPANILAAELDERYHTTTQELQLVSKPESRIKWIGGVFLMHDNQGFGGPNGLVLVGSAVGGGLAFRNEISTKSYAVFGETTLPINDSTNLTVGARWSHDARTLEYGTAVIDPTTLAPLLNLGSGQQEATYGKPTWRVMLDHHFTPDVMGYVSVSRGFKSGNFEATNSANPPFKPEILTAYEIGAKNNLLNDRLRLNVAAYYYRYDEMQLQSQPQTVQITVNAASSELVGGEINSEMVISDRLTANLGMAYEYSKFLNFALGTCEVANAPAIGGNSVVPCDLTGSRVPLTPKFTINFAPVYTIPTAVGKFTVSASYFHTSSYLWTQGGSAEQSDYGLLNAKGGWSSSDDGRIGVSVYAKNITQTEYQRFAEAGGAGNFYTPAPKRTFGIELNFKL